MTTDHIESRIAEYWSWIAVALFLLLGADLLTTLGAYDRYGAGAEFNPVMRWVLGQSLGMLVLVHLLALVVAVTIFYGLVRLVAETDPPAQRIVMFLIEGYLGILVAVGLFVVANNLAVIILGESLI